MKKHAKQAFIVGYGRMGKRHQQALIQTGFDDIFVFDCNLYVDSDQEILPISCLEEYLSKILPTLVVISTNADSHVEYLEKVVKHNVPYILCEKPLCTSLNDLIKLKETLQSYPDVHIAVNHQMRYMNMYGEIKKIIELNLLGRLDSISVHAGNFGLAMNGSHYCELFRYLTNSVPETSWGWLEEQDSKNPRGEKYKDYAGCIRVENANKQRLYIDCSNRQGHGIFVNYCFEYGQLCVDEVSGTGYMIKRKASDLHFPNTLYGLPGETDMIQFPVKNIVDSTAQLLNALMKQEEYPSLEDAEVVLKTIVAAVASSCDKNAGVNIQAIPAQYHNCVYMWA